MRAFKSSASRSAISSAREAELDLAITYQTEVEVTDELIAAFHDEILETIDRGTPAQKKAINRRMFVEVIVDGKVAYPSTVFPRQGFALWELWWT